MAERTAKTIAQGRLKHLVAVRFGGNVSAAAAAMGVKQPHLNNVTNGVKGMGLESLRAICSKLSLSADYFVDDGEDGRDPAEYVRRPRREVPLGLIHAMRDSGVHPEERAFLTSIDWSLLPNRPEVYMAFCDTVLHLRTQALRGPSGLVQARDELK